MIVSFGDVGFDDSRSRQRSKRSRLLLLPLLLAGAVSCKTSPTVPAPPIRGQLSLQITSLTENIGSFTVHSQGRPQQTGPVQLTLDPAYPRAQVIALDFDRMEIRVETRLLVNAPLLKSHGAEPTPIAVSERGSFSVLDLRRSTDGRTASMRIDYETTSAGTFETGPFAAAAQRNRKKPKVDACSFPANTARFTVTLAPDGSVEDVGDAGSASSLMCAVDEGTFSFAGHESAYTGTRTGTVAPGNLARSYGGNTGDGPGR